jgi:hypothetical protein
MPTPSHPYLLDPNPTPALLLNRERAARPLTLAGADGADGADGLSMLRQDSDGRLAQGSTVGVRGELVMASGAGLSPGGPTTATQPEV